MLDYIKQRMKECEEFQQESYEAATDDSELVLEYAHLFQELDDLTLEGEDAHRDREIAIDIPLEDDIEVDTVEFNLSDGRLTDVPMDASVQESNYLAMKTFDDFYQEAVNNVMALPRETYEQTEERRMRRAHEMFNEYKTYVIQEGLFGFDKIKLSDPSVPSRTTVDFGPMSPDKPKQNYYVKLPVLFEIDKKGNILKKQLESLSVAVSRDVFIGLAEALPNLLRRDFGDKVSSVKNIWDVLTPTKIVIPVDPVDSYHIVVGFECDFSDDLLYYGWTLPVKTIKNAGKSDHDGPMKFKMVSPKEMKILNPKSKKGYVAESYEMRRPDRFGDSFYQEAIDFGGADASGDTPPESNDTDNNDTPSVSMDDLSGNDGDNTNTNNDSDKGPELDTNNVSDQIADNVAAQTSNDDMDNSVTDISLDETPDTGDDSSENVDQKLDDLDDAGNADMGLDENGGSEIDVENMTIEELLAQGSEKLKGMTIQQLKEFLSGADGNQLQEFFTSSNPDNVYQEAVFLTKRNINKEIDTHLRKSLGILNDNEMSLDELISGFKKEGKKLNRVLSKGAKMSKVYSEDERNNISKLNKCLADLTAILKVSNDPSYTATVKRLIQAFTAQSAVVAKIVGDKNTTKKEGEENNG